MSRKKERRQYGEQLCYFARKVKAVRITENRGPDECLWTSLIYINSSTSFSQLLPSSLFVFFFIYHWPCTLNAVSGESRRLKWCLLRGPADSIQHRKRCDFTAIQDVLWSHMLVLSFHWHPWTDCHCGQKTSLFSQPSKYYSLQGDHYL